MRRQAGKGRRSLDSWESNADRLGTGWNTVTIPFGPNGGVGFDTLSEVSPNFSEGQTVLADAIWRPADKVSLGLLSSRASLVMLVVSGLVGTPASMFCRYSVIAVLIRWACPVCRQLRVKPDFPPTSGTWIGAPSADVPSTLHNSFGFPECPVPWSERRARTPVLTGTLAP